MPDNNYAIALTAQQGGDTIICMYSSKSSSGFTIITEDDQGQEEPSITVSWVAIPYSNP